MTTETKIFAKPLQFTESRNEWFDNTMGFYIGTETDEPERGQYRAAWGEDEPEWFATLEDAKAWCQSEADAWVQKIGILAACPSPPADVQDGVDAGRWRFCVQHGFPQRGPHGAIFVWIDPEGGTIYGDTLAECIDNAIQDVADRIVNP